MIFLHQLVPKHTDSFSLLVNAALTCRYSAPLSLNFLMLLPSLQETGRRTTFTHKMAENVPVAAQHFSALFPAILSVYCAAIAFNIFDRIVGACSTRGWGKKYTFEADGDAKDAERDAHTADGRRIVERERGALQGQEGNGRVGAGCPYYFELSKRDIGIVLGEPDAGDLAAVGDVERAGLLSRRGNGSRLILNPQNIDIRIINSIPCTFNPKP